MTEKPQCNHEAIKLTFSKMFINDNGSFGGQHIEVLLNCECGATLFVHSYRGNMLKEYVKPNSLHPYFSSRDIVEGKQQEIW